MTAPTFRIDHAILSEKIENMQEAAVRKAMAAKTKWLESSLERLTAQGCDDLAIEEHPSKTVITNNGEPVGTFMFTFVHGVTEDTQPHS